MDTLGANISNRPAHISAEEWAVRVDLAACYRLIAHFGWDDLVLTDNSARVPGHPDQMLINPSGLRFDEITASNLLKVDISDGHLIEPSEYEPINAGVVIHGAIYLGRPDVECVVHTHTEADIAVGALEEGLLPAFPMGDAFLQPARIPRLRGRLSRHGRARAATAQHRPPSGAGAAQSRPVGDRPQCAAEAFSSTYHFERSAEAQLKIQAAVAAGAENGGPLARHLRAPGRAVRRQHAAPPGSARMAGIAAACRPA